MGGPARSGFGPFRIDEKMLAAVIVETGDPVGMMARAAGLSVSGLRLLDGAGPQGETGAADGADPGIGGRLLRHGTDRAPAPVSVRRACADGNVPAVEPGRNNEAAEAASFEPLTP